MLRSALTLTAILAALAFSAGCNDGTVTPNPGSGNQSLAGQMADVALDSDVITEQMVNAQLASMAAASNTKSGGGTGTVIQDVTFSLTRQCPAGGEISVDGSIHREYDLETHEMEAAAAGNRTRTDCAFNRNEYTIVVNSFAEWDKFRRRVDGRPDGLQTSHYAGSTHAVRSDGEERSCEFEITIVRDPETHTRTLDGMICGTEVHRSVTWSYEE